MWKNTSINILIAGVGSRCGRFLETISSLPGLTVIGLVDPGRDPSSTELAEDLGIPVDVTAADFCKNGRPDIIINATNDDEVVEHLDRCKPPGALIINGVGARLLRVMAAHVLKNKTLMGKYMVVKREYERQTNLDDQIVGKSDEIHKVMDMIQSVAPTPTTTLLLGETGTGKDLVARSIHRTSNLKDRPFISVNCTALTSTLMESELFGYKKGAFTGAERDSIGILEEADGGTLFLDEIGDMKLELQAKMLRFLQTGEIRRVGSTRIRHVKVRVIAATNRDLEQAVEKGDFRRDLFYRFNTFTIKLPALRERAVDVPYLAYHFLTKAEMKLNKKIEGISDEALEMMSLYDWPGNVRELENVIERSVILCKDGTIQADDLPYEIRKLKPAGKLGLGPGKFADGNGFKSDKERVVANFEKKELLHYIKMANGNISEASRISGIPRRTFYRKMKKHGLDERGR